MARTRRATGTADRIVTGRAMVDHRTKRLVNRLRPGDIAIIDHEDIDRVAAESLVEAKPAAVLNVARSSSGRYANIGPLLLVNAGIVLVDDLGPALLEEVSEGDTVAIEGYKVIDGERFIAAGIRQDSESIEAVHERSRARLGAELSMFAQNTVDFVEDNQDLLADDLEVPELGDWTGRHVLIVVRGHDYKEDLAHLRGSGYLREMRPLLVAVDGGADALLERGVKPDVIVGDMDSVSEAGLSCGAELVVHAYRDGRAPGSQRLDELGLEHHKFSASGTSEDIAMLMAWDLGAELIVAVGTHSSMVDFLDKGRAGMASTVLTRMKVGPILVDAKGVSRLYGGRVRKRDLLLLVAAALFAMVVVIVISEPIRLLIRTNWVLLTGYLSTALGVPG
ncbi:MAG: putative cytokinetic ring protein SteA [Microthrixaceae bacterium]